MGGKDEEGDRGRSSEAELAEGFGFGFVDGALVGLEEAVELADAGGVAHFAEGFGFDLADALAGDLELAAYFFEGAAVAVLEAEAEGEDVTLALGEGVENVHDFLPEEGEGGHVVGVFGGLVFDEVAEVGVVAVADGTLQGDGLLGHLHDVLHLVHGEAHFDGHFVGGGFVTEFRRSCFWICMTLLRVSIMWTGMRMVRAWSAMERVMAWRIHQVA